MGTFKEQQAGKRETKEEKTQEYLLKYVFENLYDQLNLSQFVNTDQTVRTGRNPGEVVECF